MGNGHSGMDNATGSGIGSGIENGSQKGREKAIENASEKATESASEKAAESARGLRKAAASEERKVEAEKGSELKKGARRFDERSRSSDGKSAESKQR